jgi:hypothetical protein
VGAHLGEEVQRIEHAEVRLVARVDRKEMGGQSNWEMTH